MIKENSKKVAVIGAGTNGLLTAMALVNWLPISLEVYYTKEKPPLSVGEGANFALPGLIKENTHLLSSNIEKLLNGTKKFGIQKNNWGGKDFMHEFLPGNYSFHFDSSLLRDYLMDFLQDKVTFIEKNIVDKSEIDADFIYDCSGFPDVKNDSSIEQLESIPVNSSCIIQSEWEGPRFEHTVCEAMLNGWVFMVPLQNRCSVGYIYNSEISSEKEIKEELKELLKKYNLNNSDNFKILKFNNYKRKENFTWNHAYNGNASFFMEPLEATTLGNTISLAQQSVHLIGSPGYLNPLNLKYHKMMDGVEDMIALHYLAGSKYNTEFWDMAKQKAEKRLLASPPSETRKRMMDLVKVAAKNKHSLKAKGFLEYGTWPLESWIQNLDNLNIYEKLNDLWK